MGRSLEENYKRRFGNMRFVLVFPEKPLEGAERRLQNEKMVEAYTACMAALLGRPPTDREITGKEDISKKIKAKKEELAS